MSRRGVIKFVKDLRQVYKKTETHIFAYYGAYCLFQGLFSVRDLHELKIQKDCMATRNELSTEFYD
jgi:hypothetical protein